MQLKVIRCVYTDTATLGKLFINGEFFAYTLEDKDRNMNGDCSKKVQNKTAIDEGHYTVVCSFSNRFQKYLPEILNVKCFAGIRIHGGNTHENSEGCILIGAQSNMKDRIGNCASKVSGLVAKMKAVERKEKITIDIVKEMIV